MCFVLAAAEQVLKELAALVAVAAAAAERSRKAFHFFCKQVHML